MLYNTIQAFQDKLNSLDRFDFYAQQFNRGNKPHYTQTLGIDEGTFYRFGNEYSRRLLKRIAPCSDVGVKVYGSPVVYDESTNTHTIEAPEWVTIDCYSIGDGEYPYENFEGFNDDGEKRTIYLDQILYFEILPTQEPSEVKEYNPCNTL